MRMLVLAVALLVGCATPEAAPGDVPSVGGGGKDSGAAEGGADAGPACDATVDMLSGRATFVAGSVVAADPQAMAPFDSGSTCGALVEGTNWDGTFGDITVTAGMSGSYSMQLVTGAAAGATCAYTLRLTTASAIAASGCGVTRDYLLTVP